MSESTNATDATPLYERTCEKSASKGGAPEKLKEADLLQFKAQLCPSWEVIKKIFIQENLNCTYQKA